MLGSPKVDNQYHSGWAWAGSTPYKGTKLLASHFGGIRNPMVIQWPAKIKPDATPRPQFHHCNDIVPAVYDVVGITPPLQVNGIPQDPIDGVSFAYTFDDPKAKGRLLSQYFEIMGSHSQSTTMAGWPLLSARVPLGRKAFRRVFESGRRTKTFGSSTTLRKTGARRTTSAKMPEKLAQLKDIFLIEATKNKVLPIGGGLWIPLLHPEMRITPPYTEWTFYGDTVRMPEVCAGAWQQT